MDKKGSMEFPLQKIEETPGYLLWQVAMFWQRSINKILLGHGLTYTQFIVLVITGSLRNKQNLVFQHQVAKYARIDRMMTSRVIASLERKKLITRIKNSDDARANQVSLTTKGEEIMYKALNSTAELEKHFFDMTALSEPHFTGILKEILDSTRDKIKL
jgi:DNA-binding MarR family transcriptional regulator